MPFIMLYFIKLSVSLAVVFLFYHFVLRKLTFYNWNRWYLLGYTLLSFFIPFINISPVLDKYEWTGSEVITWVPVIDSNTVTINSVVQKTTPVTTWQVLLLSMVAGMLVLFLRFLIQYISYRSLLKRSSLISAGEINVYEINENIIPFSFGHSIFMNPALHTKEELEEIIKHEMVHVRQQHTFDIIWGELLCIVNWFNPFAWLIRKAIRQNLEFIADRKVLEHGFDKTAYQYLLLKVIGNNRFSIAHQFNFSSLKKRIAMMNKLKTARVHLFRFLFVLPLFAVILLSFRYQGFKDRNVLNNNAHIGIVVDAHSFEPLSNVKIFEKISGIETFTDKKGFFSLPISGRTNNTIFLFFVKEGYRNMEIPGISTKSDLPEGLRDIKIVGLNTTEYLSNKGVFISTIPIKTNRSEADDYDIAYKALQRKKEYNLFRTEYPRSATDTIPHDNLPDDYKAFLKTNPLIKEVYWNRNPFRATICFKDGKKETYNLENKEEVKKAEMKYGTLPEAPRPRRQFRRLPLLQRCLILFKELAYQKKLTKILKPLNI